jgi:hypothetical protein
MKKKLTIWTLIVLISFFAILGWWKIYSYFQGQEVDWLWPVLFFSISLLLQFILIFISKDFAKLTALITFIPSLFININLYSILIFCFCFGIYYLGTNQINKILKNSIKLDFTLAILFGYALITTPLCLIISSNYYFELKQKEEKGTLPKINIEIPQKITDFTLSSFNNLLAEDFYFSNPHQTVNEFIEDKLVLQAEEKNLNPEEILNQENIESNKQQLARSLDMEINGDEKMAQVFHSLINQEIDHYLNASQEKNNITAWGLSLALFITLKTLTWLFRMPIAFFCDLIMKLLIKMKILETDERSINIKRVV